MYVCVPYDRIAIVLFIFVKLKVQFFFEISASVDAMRM